MKYFIFIIVTFLALGSSLPALGSDTPLITKSSSQGYTVAEYIRNERCQVFKDKVVIQKTFGVGLTTSQEFSYQITESIFDTIEKAKSEQTIEKPNMLCDGPSTLIQAGETLLYTTGGCGSPKVSRMGPYTSALKDIVGQFCKRTH